MRSLLTAILLCVVWFGAVGTTSQAAEPQKILMIGNSLTYTYDIPAILERFASETKRTLKVDKHVAGGQTLNWHWTNPAGKVNQTAPQVIAKGGYDLVILQDSGQPIAKSAEGAAAFARVIPEYVTAIQDASMQAMLYMAHPTAKGVNPVGLQPIIDAYAKAADAQDIACAAGVRATASA